MTPERTRSTLRSVKLLDRLLHRKRPESQPGPQGEEYEALKMSRRAANEREAFAENIIRKDGHKSHPFLDDPSD
jgi:hypothetical protein